MASKKQAIEAARLVWGKRAIVRENPNADTKAEREAAAARRRDIVERRRQIEVELRSCSWSLRALLSKARFVVDVNGGNPSIQQLEAELVKAERHQELSDEAVSLKQEMLELGHGTYRWSAGYEGRPMPCFCIEAQADTIEELIEKIEAKPKGVYL